MPSVIVFHVSEEARKEEEIVRSRTSLNFSGEVVVQKTAGVELPMPVWSSRCDR